MVERKKAKEEEKEPKRKIVWNREENFDERGKFKKGNIIGRMPKGGYTLKDLTKAIRRYEKEKGFSFIELYLKRIEKSDRLLDSMMNRYIAQKTETNITGGLELSINIQKKYTDGKEEN